MTRDLTLVTALCTRFEGIEDGDRSTPNLDPYLDPAGVWTIGLGHAIRGLDGRFLRGPEKRAAARALYPGGLTLAEAEVLLQDDLRPVVVWVERLTKALRLTDRQFNALVSFDFNTGGLSVSRLLRCLRARDQVAATGAFMGWCAIRGVRAAGLVRRRACEAAVFAGEVDVATMLADREAPAMRTRVLRLFRTNGDLAWLRRLIAGRAAA